ncbi:MAG: hypothetical protein HC817_08170 [Saprospiraceae bacterium]|nr:hypothetical protein [Saprospiraceae bacterium]
MQPLKAIVIDDEELSRKNVEQLIKTFCPDVDIVERFDSALKAVDFCAKTTLMWRF